MTSCSSSSCCTHPLHPLCSRLCPCPVPCAADLCLLAQETWRSSPRCACVLSRSRAAPKCRAGWPWPWPHEAAGRIVVPGGPYQYYVVHQYSAVRRVWGASGVYMFLFFAPPTPPHNLMAALLSTPVRCRKWQHEANHDQHKSLVVPIGNRPIILFGLLLSIAYR